MKKKLLLISLASVVTFSIYSQANNEGKPEIFLPGIVSTGYNERDMAIAPNGNEMFYTIQAPRAGISVIVYRSMKGKQWSEAAVASFSGQFSDLEPVFAPDGKKLFFVSNRPLANGNGPKDYDIWFVVKTAQGWGIPVHAGMQLNSVGDEYYPSITADGSVYFTAARPDALGKEDIYKSQWKDNQFNAPENIGKGVNSKLDEFNAFVDPNERYIIFGTEGGEGDQGRGDLYISYRNTDGTWTKAKNLGSNINSKRLDYCPYIHNDTFYFTSERPIPPDGNKPMSLLEIKNKLDTYGNGWGDIYYIPLNQVIRSK